MRVRINLDLLEESISVCIYAHIYACVCLSVFVWICVCLHIYRYTLKSRGWVLKDVRFFSNIWGLIIAKDCLMCRPSEYSYKIGSTVLHALFQLRHQHSLQRSNSHVYTLSSSVLRITRFACTTWYQRIQLGFDKNNPEMGIDSAARQMYQKTVQHYWVNIVKQQVTGGGCPTLRDTLFQPMEAALNQTTFLTQAQALLSKAVSEHTTQPNARVKSIINKKRQVVPKRMPPGAHLAVNTHNSSEHT